MASKADFKNIFQSSLKDMLIKKEKQSKKKDNMDVHNCFLKTHGRYAQRIYEQL
jgi:hypothetical protein